MDVVRVYLRLRDQVDEKSTSVDPRRHRRIYDRMVETSAIAAAAAESVLRQGDTQGKTFYESE
jgi:hypothetical protein